MNTNTCLFDTAHQLLFAGRWSEARSALDVLAQDNQNTSTLFPIAAYEKVANAHRRNPPLGADTRKVLSGKIDEINLRAIKLEFGKSYMQRYCSSESTKIQSTLSK
jgi:hypothetical protein